MPKIKRCPKCGGIAVFDNVMGIMYQVRCYDCSVGTYVYWNKKKAIDEWNSYKKESEVSE